MHFYKPILSQLKHTIFLCFLFSVNSSDWITLMIKGLGEPTRQFKGNKLCYVIPSSGFNITNATNVNDPYLLDCFFFFFFSISFSLCINYGYSNEKCLTIRRKIGKGDMTCRNNPHFRFAGINIVKMVMQSSVCPFEANNNICSPANFFLFTEDLSPRDVDIS